MDTRVSRTDLSSSGRELVFVIPHLLIVPCREVCGSARSLPQTVRPSFIFILKLLADWSHWKTNYNVWQLICFCSQLQMPWGEMSECESTHSSHYLCSAMTCWEKYVNISQQGEYDKSFIISACCCCCWDRANLVIGALLPSGQTPKATKGGEKRPFPVLLQDYTTAINKRHEATNWLAL